MVLAQAMSVGDFFPALVVGTFGLAITAGILGLFSPEGDERFVRHTVVWGILLRALLLLVIFQTIGPYPFAPDAISYETVATKLARYWSGLRPPVRDLQGTFQIGYYIENAAFFWLFGEKPLAPMMLNLFFGAWLAVPAYHMALLTSRDRGVARGTALLSTFFPSLILWSVLNVREAPTIFTLVLAVLLTLRLARRFEVVSLLGVVAALALLAAFREYLFVLVGVAAGLGVLVSKGRSPIQGLLVSCVVLLAVTVGYRSLGLGTDVVNQDAFQTVEYLRRDLALGANSAYGQGFDTSSPAGALRFLPVGLAYFLLAPFPWRVGSALELATLPEQLVWYALVPFALWGLLLSLRRDPRSWMVVLLVTVVVTLSYAMVEGNVGTAYRHRAQIYPFLFLFVAVGLKDAHDRWRARRRRREEARGRARAALRRPARRSPSRGGSGGARSGGSRSGGSGGGPD